MLAAFGSDCHGIGITSLDTVDMCKDAAKEIGFDYGDDHVTYKDSPKGCYASQQVWNKNNGKTVVYWNKHPRGSPSPLNRGICRSKFSTK